MKIGKEKLSKYFMGITVGLTTTMCAITILAHNDYTYSKPDVNNAAFETGDEEPSSEITDILEELDYQINTMIENKKKADYEKYYKTHIVYDGLTMEELSNKLEKNLTSTLDGTGKLFAEYSVNLGLDPYLAVSIVLLETGCNWDCSYLVKACNNVGGMKGGPGCNGGSYKKFQTLEKGITKFMDYLYNNYYSKGLTTPEAINPSYAESTSWAYKVNKYISKIKAS